MKSLVVQPCAAPLLAVEPKSKPSAVGFRCQPSKRSSLRFNAVTCCSASPSSSSSSEMDELVEAFLHPKPFGKRPMLMRMGKGPTYVEKTSKELSDYCETLEGDDYCSCWEAYLELGNYQSEWSESRVENLISLSGGLDSLVKVLHRNTAMDKRDREASVSSAPLNKGGTEPKVKMDEVPYKGGTEPKVKMDEVDGTRKQFPVPDELPKSKEELEEEERWLKSSLPDSPHTRLLRAMHIYPAWYIPRPDHETD